MRNKIILGIVIIVLLLAGGFYWYKHRPSPMSQNNAAQQTPAQTVSETSKWADAIKSGTPTTCTMSKGTDTMEYFIQGKKMRANMTISTPASPSPKIILSHMINDEQYLYMWQDGQTNGTKMNLSQPSPSPVANPNTTKPADVPKFDDQNSYDNLKTEGYTIACTNGGFDSSIFAPPSDVKFIDPSEMMKQVAPVGSNNQVDMQKIKELQKQYGY